MKNVNKADFAHYLSWCNLNGCTQSNINSITQYMHLLEAGVLAF